MNQQDDEDGMPVGYAKWYDNYFGGQVAELAELRLRAKQSDDCVINKFMSCVCARGTKSCVVEHDKQTEQPEKVCVWQWKYSGGDAPPLYSPGCTNQPVGLLQKVGDFCPLCSERIDARAKV